MCSRVYDGAAQQRAGDILAYVNRIPQHKWYCRTYWIFDQRFLHTYASKAGFLGVQHARLLRICLHYFLSNKQDDTVTTNVSLLLSLSSTAGAPSIPISRLIANFLGSSGCRSEVR